MRITVHQLAEMWRGAAESFGSDDEVGQVRADQLRACAKDLETAHLAHEIVKDKPVNGVTRWWKRVK